MRFSMDDSNNLQKTQFGQMVSIGSPGLAGMLQTGLSNISIQNDWKAAWLFSLGADLDITDQWTIRGGIALETDPLSTSSSEQL